jgi:hyperosmotically inducible protein
MTAGAIALVVGCTTMRDLDAISAHVGDSTITNTLRSRLAEDGVVDARSITVETSNGNVVLSGVARSTVERITAESIAIKGRGVKSLQNNIVVRP